jgi:hypothetical protein
MLNLLNMLNMLNMLNLLNMLNMLCVVLVIFSSERVTVSLSHIAPQVSLAPQAAQPAPSHKLYKLHCLLRLQSALPSMSVDDLRAVLNILGKSDWGRSLTSIVRANKVLCLDFAWALLRRLKELLPEYQLFLASLRIGAKAAADKQEEDDLTASTALFADAALWTQVWSLISSAFDSLGCLIHFAFVNFSPGSFVTFFSFCFHCFHCFSAPGPSVV